MGASYSVNNDNRVVAATASLPDNRVHILFRWVEFCSRCACGLTTASVVSDMVATYKFAAKNHPGTKHIIFRPQRRLAVECPFNLT